MLRDPLLQAMKCNSKEQAKNLKIKGIVFLILTCSIHERRSMRVSYLIYFLCVLSCRIKNFFITLFSSAASLLSRAFVSINISAVGDLFVLLVILPVFLDLVHDCRVRIRSYDDSQRRVLHHRKLIHSLCTFRGVSGLRAVSLRHRVLRIHMIVCRMSLLGEGHGSSSPIGTESAWLNAGKFNAPLWLDFLADGLSKAFDSPLGRWRSALSYFREFGNGREGTVLGRLGRA
jgi:hypothetical protein